MSSADANQSEFQPRAATPSEPESKLWEGGFSPKAMYGTWLISGLVSLAILIALILVPWANVMELSLQSIWTFGIGVILLWWVLAIGTYLYRRLGMFYELTSQRFIHTSGILVRTTDRIDVIDIDDVAYTQGLVQRMLGVGTIKLVSKDRSHPNLILRGIDQVDKIAGMIDDVRRKERKKRSLHIDAG
ncbi:MAG: PH domain-containing protein [Pirellula sp.]|jgi:membrane protein YdbS with pleckstrin-like domain|nr:PH domain-containing protein [Pirellula sp.]